MSTYVHQTSRDARGRHRPTAWHIIRAPLAHSRTYATYCGRTLVSDDLMEDTPMAATCETCFRYEAKARERQGEDDPATSPVDPVVDVP